MPQGVGPRVNYGVASPYKREEPHIRERVPPTGGSVKQVFAPLRVPLAQHTHQMTAGVQAERTGLACELHSSLVGSAIALAIVARMTERHKILPGRLTGAGARDDVVQRQFAGGHRAVAILARVPVAHQNIFSRKSARLVRDSPVFQKPDYRWKAHVG